jgi:hypothetical protein
MPRYLRYLRIAFSATCGIACVLLVMLWVRSHFVIEGIVYFSRGPFGSTHTLIGVNNGTFQVTHATFPRDRKLFTDGWSYETTTWDDATESFFDWAHFPEGFLFQFPIWLLAIFIAVATWIPWADIKWRFSLRNLLIATTLIAVGLGIIVWMTQAG